MPEKDYAAYYSEFRSLLADRAFLRIREGCYVRAGDITSVAAGYPDKDGQLVHQEVVMVYLGNGGIGVSFEPCASADEAVRMADALAAALGKAGT